MSVNLSDIEILTNLNAAYLHSDQNGDIDRYAELLADDFFATLPGSAFLNKLEFLKLMEQPRPFTDLACHDLKIRLLGDFAIIHAKMTYRDKNGKLCEGRYTDDYQRRNGRWICVSANVVTD